MVKLNMKSIICYLLRVYNFLSTLLEMEGCPNKKFGKILEDLIIVI